MAKRTRRIKLRTLRRRPYDELLNEFVEKAKAIPLEELSKKIDRKEKWINWFIFEQSKALSRRDLEALCRKMDIDICRKKETVQKMFLYCDCGNELISSDSFVSDSYDKKMNNHVKFKCSKCGKELDFDFDVPVPQRWADDGSGYAKECEK